MFDPLGCPIDEHRIRFTQGENTLAHCDPFGWYAWGKKSNMRDTVEIDVAAGFATTA